MSGDRQQRIKELFQQALGLDSSERQQFLARQCSEDESDLRSEVELLLDSHESESGILDEPPRYAAFGLLPPPGQQMPEPGESLVGSEVGNYRLLEFIGQGGMGLVYLAEQQQPVRRRVALKIVKSGYAAAEILARFGSERQALALMDHPNIARIYDADATADGRPYFTMEHVAGLSIIEYCERHRLTIDERIELFLGVCDGVQHAHQKGIIHRDLKPSNILVAVKEAGAVPKIIDFGVSKALHQPLTDSSPVTAHGYLVGTPDYMSPEQAYTDGRDIDTRADIYSLGALLYQLLCGVLPIDSKELRENGYGQIKDNILRVEPPPPSVRTARLDNLENVAHNRRVRPRALRRLLRHDLDWITMRALEKDRTRRYPAVSDLSADLRRHLTGEPVLAGPPSLGYRFGKFVKKNKVAVTAVLAVLLTLAGGLVASLNFAYRAESALKVAAESSNRANRSARKSERISEYLQDILRAASPRLGGGANVTILEALDRADRQLDAEFSDSLGVRAELRTVLADIYRDLGIKDRAEHHASQGLRELREATDPDPSYLARGLAVEGLILCDRGQLVGATRLFEEALDVLRQDGVKETSNLYGSIRSNLMTIKGQLGPFDEESIRYEKEIAEKAAATGERSTEVARQHLRYGQLLAFNELFDESEVHLELALDIFRHEHGEDHVNTAKARYYLGAMHRRKGNYEIAVSLLREACQIHRRHLPPDHMSLLMAEACLARALSNWGRRAEADSLFKVNLPAVRQSQNTSPLRVGIALLYLGEHLLDLGEDRKALACYLEADSLAGELDSRTAFFLKDITLPMLAFFDREQGEWQAARHRLEANLDLRRQRLRRDHPKIISTLADLTRTLIQLLDLQAAQLSAAECFSAASREYGTFHEETWAAAEMNLELGKLMNDPSQIARWKTWLVENKSPPPVEPSRRSERS